MSKAIVCEFTKFIVSGLHTCGDSWVPFTVIKSFDHLLDGTLVVSGQKTVVVGSWWQGSIGCGCTLRVTMNNSLNIHLLNGKKIVSEIDRDPNLTYQFIGCSGYAYFVGWVGGQRLAFI